MSFFSTYYHLRSRVAGIGNSLDWHFGNGRQKINEARGARILLYHGICQNDPFRYNTLFITKDSFEKQLILYKKYCNIISLDEFFNNQFRQDRFSIVLTFDDGFANNHDYVLPLLEKYQVPACFFITAIRRAGYEILWNDAVSLAYRHGPRQIQLDDEVFAKDSDQRYRSKKSNKLLAELLRQGDRDEKERWVTLLKPYYEKAHRDYWAQMDQEQIRALSQNQWVTIGSHSYFHDDLRNQSPGVLKKDLIDSKSYLEGIIDRPIQALAFPYGSYDSLVLDEAKKAGYNQLLCTNFVFEHDQNEATLKERLTINPFISNLQQLYANVYGTY